MKKRKKRRSKIEGGDKLPFDIEMGKNQKATGDKGVRKHEDYMSKYFISQYGAIKDIDFTPIFEEILCDEKEE